MGDGAVSAVRAAAGAAKRAAGAVVAVIQALVSVWNGLRTTVGYIPRRPITVQYPFEKLQLPERYRGNVELLFDEQTGQPKCTSCMACVRICPAQCISVLSHREPGVKGKILDLFAVNNAYCLFCSLCVEVCPVDAIRMGREYEQTGYDRPSLHNIWRREGFDETAPVQPAESPAE